MAAALKFHRAWEVSRLFPDTLKKFEKEIEKLQKEVEDHEEILVDLQGYGSGIGRWGSVAAGRSKASSRGSKREDGPSRVNRKTSRGNRRGRDPNVDDGEEEAADSGEGNSSSKRSEYEDGEEESGQVSSMNAPARDAANVSRPRLSIPRHRDASAVPPRSALKRGQDPPQVSRRTIPLLPGPESPKTIEKEKPRFRFRKGIKAYMNDFLDYKVNELVDYKVEKRLALERSREPSRGLAPGLVNRSIKFSEKVEISIPEPRRASPKITKNKRSVPQIAQPVRPRSSRVRRSSPYRARARIPAPALYRVKSSRREKATSRAKTPVSEVVDDEPEVGNLDTDGRGGQDHDWVDDVQEEEEGKEYIDEDAQDAEEVEEPGSGAVSLTPNDGFPDADDDLYQDIRSMARISRDSPRT